MKKIVIVSGFSGTGKSTLVERIAKEFGLRVIYTSQLLKKIREQELEKLDSVCSEKKTHGWWEGKEGKKYLEDRLKNSKMDKILDAALLKEVKKGNVAMDSWTMGYLQKEGVKIWLNASQHERAKRLAGRDKMPYKVVLEKINYRDKKEKAIYKKAYGIDFGDLTPFDLVLNTDYLKEIEVQEIALLFLRKVFRKN